MSVPNINAIGGLSIPNLGILSSSMSNNTSSTFITAPTSSSLTNVLPLQARPNISRMAPSANFDPGPLIESALKVITDYINDWLDSKTKNVELQKTLLEVTNNYSAAVNKYNSKYQAYKDLQERQPNLEDIPAHLAQIEANLKELNAAGKALRVAADNLSRKTGEDQIDKYLDKGRIVTRQVDPLKAAGNSARATLTATENIDAFTSQELQACQNGLLDQHINEISPFFTEFNELISKIRKPDTSDEDRTRACAQVEELKGVLDQRIEEIIEVAGNAKWSTSDWSSLQTNISANVSEAQFYALADADIERNLRALALENPQQYLEQARKYQLKLLQLNRHQRAADFSVEWMNSIPAEAKWQDVELMVKAFACAEGLKHQKLPEITHAFENWIASQPNTEELKNEHTLARGSLGFLKGDMSLEARQDYKTCQELRPDELLWNEMLATFDIETFQWDKAKKDLLSLPNERADDRKLKIAASQYKLYSFGFDAGRYVFSNYLKPALKEKFKGKWGEQALDLADNGLQIAAEPLIKEFVCTQLLDYPDAFSAATQGNGFGPLLSGVSFACTAAKMGMKPTLDFFVKDQASRKWWKESIERPISVMLDVTGTGARVLLPFQMGAGSLTAGNLAGNLVVVLAPPALSLFEDLMGDKLGHNHRAMLRTANKIAADLTPISLLCQGGEIASSYAKGALIKYGAEHLGTTLVGSTLLKGATCLASPGVFIPLVIVYRTIFDYPNMRTATLLEEMKKQHTSNNPGKVEELRQEAQNWLIGNSQAVSHYNDCLGFFRFVPNRTTISENDRLELDRFLPKVNDALTSLMPIDTSSGIRSNLLYHKVAYFLSIDHPNNYAEAKRILSNEKIDPQLYAQLISFIIPKADSLARQNFDTADRFLNGAKEIFRDPAYNNIVAKYQEHIAVRRRNPQLTSTSTVNEITAWWRSIDAVRLLVDPIPELAQLNESLQSNMVNQFLALKRYSDVVVLFNTFGYLDLEAKYRTTQDFLQRDLEQTLSETIRQQMNRLLPNVDQTLESLKPIAKYSEVRRDLLFRKAAFFLSLDNPENYEKAKTILDHETRDEELYAHLIYFILSRADSLARQNFDSAERFLERSKNIFPTAAHNNIVAKYKAYITQKRNPQLTAASTVDEINAWLRAIDNVRLSVSSIPELASFNEHLESDIVNQLLNLRKYDELAMQMGRFGDTVAETKYRAIQDFLRHNSIPVASPEKISQMRGLLSHVNQAQEALTPMKKYSAVSYDLMCHDLAFLLSIDQYAGVRRVLSYGGLDPRLYHRMVDFIVKRAEVLASTNLDIAEQFIDGVREIFPNPAHNSIIEKYKDHIAVRKRTPRLTANSSEDEITAWSQSIEEVRSRVSQFQELAPLKESLERCILNQHVDLNRYDDIANLLERYGNPDAATAYRATRGFLQQDPTQSPSDATKVQMNQLIRPVDTALASLLSNDSYSATRRELLYRKVTFFLSGNDDRDYNWAKTFLDNERIDPQLYQNLVTFIIGKADALVFSNFDKAKHFLEKTQQIFRDPAYNNIVAKYKDYISIRKRIPELTATTPENEINAWLQSIDDVKTSVSQIPELAWLPESLQKSIVYQFLSLGKYDQLAGQLVRFGDTDLARKYRAVQDFLRHDSIQAPSDATRLQLNGLLPNVNQALEALKPLKHYEVVRRDLLYGKVAFQLSADNYEEARTILSNEDHSPELYARLIDFMIRRADSFTPENFDSAQHLLERSKEIFPVPAFKAIVAKYKEYSFCLKNNPETLPQVRDDFIAQVEGIKEMSWLHEFLLVGKFKHYVSTQQYTQARTTLALTQISAPRRSQLTKDLSLYLIDKGERLLVSNNAGAVYRELRAIALDCGMLEDPVLKPYLLTLKFLAQCETQKASIESFNAAIQAIDSVLTENEFFLKVFKRRKIDCYFTIGDFEYRQQHYQNALQSYTSAKTLLLSEESRDPELLDQVDRKIYRLTHHLNRYNYEYKTN